MSRQMGPVMWQVPSQQLPQMEMSTPICLAHVLTSSRGRWIYPPGWMWYLISFTFQLCNKLGTPGDPAWLLMLPGLVMNLFPLSPWEHREESSRVKCFQVMTRHEFRPDFHQTGYYNNTLLNTGYLVGLYWRKGVQMPTVLDLSEELKM